MKSNLKPWQLVYVRSSTQDMQVQYIGELVSMPTPQDTIMVRVIPGHPGVLSEEPITNVELVEPGLWSVHYASIDGKRNNFPVDMLRYDRCLPVSFKLEQEPERQTMRVVVDDGSTTLIVAQINRRKWPTWTPLRWMSFNWALSEMDSERFIQHPHAQEAA